MIMCIAGFGLFFLFSLIIKKNIKQALQHDLVHLMKNGGEKMGTLNSGDISWMLVSSALVMLMTPGLAFFYGGLVKRKNVLNTLMSSISIMGLASVLWVLIGFSLAFSGDVGGIIGNLKWSCLTAVGIEPGPFAPDNTQLIVCNFSNDVCSDYTGTNHRCCR